jgi:hypothetical protein
MSLDTSGSNFELPAGYDIAEEDRSIAADILSKDPVHHTPGPVTGGENLKVPAQLKATALPPHLRDPIVQQLRDCPPERREALEHQLVMEAGYGVQAALRMRAGAGPSANAYHRELFAIEGDLANAERELWQAEQELADVAEYDRVTGKAIDRLQGQARHEKEAYRDRLLHRIAQINDGGTERELRLKKALATAIADQKTAAARAEEEREAQALAKDNARKKRIEERAATIARVHRDKL